MKMKCLACGVEKDLSVKEMYPFPDDGVITDEPVSPLFVIECQRKTEWRVAIMCHACCHRLEPDMWISDRCWESLEPATPFEQLPAVSGDGPDRFALNGTQITKVQNEKQAESTRA